MTSMIRPLAASLAALVTLSGCGIGSPPVATPSALSASPRPKLKATPTSSLTLDGIVLTQKGIATCDGDGKGRKLTVTEAKNADYGKITAEVAVGASGKVTGVVISTSTSAIGKQTVTYRSGIKGLKAPALVGDGPSVTVTGRGSWVTRQDPKGSTVVDFVLQVDCPRG